MATMTDQELVTRVREELYWGCVTAAKELTQDITDPELRHEMYMLVKDYESY